MKSTDQRAPNLRGKGIRGRRLVFVAIALVAALCLLVACAPQVTNEGVSEARHPRRSPTPAMTSSP